MIRLITWNRIDKWFWRITFSVVAVLMLVVVILLVLAVTTVEGAGHAAVARIRVETPNCYRYASATLVDDDGRRGLLLTAQHTFRRDPDSVSSPTIKTGSITATFPNGRAFAATLLATDPTWDLAGLEIATTGLTPMALATDYATAGDMLSSCGYGTDGKYWCNTGRAIGYGTPTGQGLRETLMLTGYARDGDSGGPILNSRGELVAVLWGTDGRIVSGTFVGRVRQFLANCRRGRSQPAPPSRCPPGPQPWQPSPILPRAPMEPVVPLPGPGTPAPVQLAGDPRVDQLVTRVDGLTTWRAELVKNILPRVDDDVGQVREDLTAAIATSGAGAKEAIAGLMPWVLSALGLGGATPAVLALWGLVRMLRKPSRASLTPVATAPGPRPPGPQPPQQRPYDAPPAPPPPPPEPIVVHHDTRPPPQTVRRDREFVPYEAPNGRRKALEWAHDEYVKKYPGARSIIDTIEAYAAQYESGLAKPQNHTQEA